jgi:hypothetical protein
MKGTTNGRDWLRNLLIVKYINLLTGPEFGFKPTRNATTLGGSAADILAVALQRCGYGHITTDMIWNVYHKRKTDKEVKNVLGS